MAIRTLLIVLVLLPVAMFAAHAVVYRVMRARGRRPTAHTSAIMGILLCGGVLLAVVAGQAWQAGLGVVTAICQLAYVAGVTVAMGILYLDVVNVAETSLHMHLLLRIAWGERLSLESLVEQYSPSRIVAERLDRLTALGQIRREGDGYHVADRTALRLAAVIDVWRRAIGLPTSPDDRDA